MNKTTTPALAGLPQVKALKIDSSECSIKEIVETILKYRGKFDIWVKTPKFRSLTKNGWLIFKCSINSKNSIGEQPYSFKRAMDFSLGLLFLLLSTPVFVVTAVLIKISSKGWSVIFSQPRVDNKEKLFTFYKFRTMNHCPSETLHYEFMQKSIKGESSNNKVHKMVDDPRITTIGKVLRRSSIDELPQLINVIKGDMSLIGPRPPIPYEVKIYENWQRARFQAKPGMTGLWQVMGRSFLSFDEMVLLDLYYALNQSFKLDLFILFRTLPALLLFRGAF